MFNVAVEPMTLESQSLSSLSADNEESVSPLSVPDPFEPNDTFGTAYDFGVVTDNFTEDTLSSPAGDEDWFRFQIVIPGAATSQIQIFYEFNYGTLNLELYDASGVKIADDTGATGFQQISLSGLASGTYFIRVENLGNGSSGPDVSSYTLFISPPKGDPDLAVQNLSVSDAIPPIRAGDTLTVEYDLANIGAATARGFQRGVYLSTDATVTTDDTELPVGGIGLFTLTAGSALHFTDQASLPAGLASGTYWVGVIADVDDVVAESSEANNIAAAQITVTSGVGGGTDGPDVLAGGEGPDTIDGLGGDDEISGLGGNDTLSGGAGDDTLIGGAGADSLDGGTDIDTASYEGAAAGVRARLDFGGGDRGEADGDSFVSIENLRGSDHDDHLNGDGAANILEGLAGDDFLVGRGGDDVILGGEGGDRILGEDGTDTASYEHALAGVRARLNVNGGEGGGDRGEADGDTFSSVENLRGSAHNDHLNGNPGPNRLEGQDGNDFLSGFGGVDVLIGGGGDDRLLGGNQPDELFGGDGDDLLFGRGNADLLDGGEGIDTASYATAPSGVRARLHLGSGDRGEANGDVYAAIENLTGSAYGDHLTGDDGANRLDGEDGDDLISGFAGADILTGGGGDDRLIGGDGDDVAVYRGVLAEYAIAGDTITDTVAGRDGIDSLSGIETLRFTDGDVMLA